MNVKYFDLDRIFAQEGAKIVHMSGLIAALSEDASEFCLEIARAAKKHGSRISLTSTIGHLFGEVVKPNCQLPSRRLQVSPIYSSVTKKIFNCAWISKDLRQVVKTSAPRSMVSKR